MTWKPLLVRSVAACPAAPATPLPFSTRTWTFPGLVVATVTGCCVGFAFGIFGSARSCASARKSRLACGCSQTTRLGSDGAGMLGTVTNCTVLVFSRRRSPASASMSLSDRPWSVVSALAASRRTEYILL